MNCAASSALTLQICFFTPHPILDVVIENKIQLLSRRITTRCLHNCHPLFFPQDRVNYPLSFDQLLVRKRRMIEVLYQTLLRLISPSKSKESP